MVEYGRMDVVIANQFTGQKLLKDLQLKKVLMLTPPLQSDPLYHYLHRKHAAIVPELVSILEHMRRSGQIDRIKKGFGVKD